MRLSNKTYIHLPWSEEVQAKLAQPHGPRHTMEPCAEHSTVSCAAYMHSQVMCTPTTLLPLQNGVSEFLKGLYKGV